MPASSRPNSIHRDLLPGWSHASEIRRETVGRRRPIVRGRRAAAVASPLLGFLARPPSVQLSHEPLRVFGVIGGRIDARTARRGETAERWDALRPLPGAGLPQIGPDQRLWAMLECLFD